VGRVHDVSGAEKMSKLFGAKGLYYLLALATLGMLLGASMKWHGC